MTIDGAMNGAEEVPSCEPACDGDTPVCNAAEQCVECTEDEHCSGGTPACSSEGKCVACRESRHCRDFTAARCSNEVCSQCQKDADCGHFPRTPVCNESTGTCEGCESDSDCETLGDGRYCDSETKACVQCTWKTELPRCGEFTCSSLSHLCTGTKRASRGACEPCESDTECTLHHKCVFHSFQGQQGGHYCLPENEPTECGTGADFYRPQVHVAVAHSLDGSQHEVCLPPIETTCQGVADSARVSCRSDDDCGETELQDGYCPTTGESAGLCSYFCTTDFDCRPGLRCAGNPLHCQPE